MTLQDKSAPNNHKSTPNNHKELNWLKILTEYGPLIVFLIFYYTTGNLMVGIISIVTATTIGLLTSWILWRHIPMVPLITALVVLLFGGLSLYSGNPAFYKMKPTILLSLMGVVLIGGLAFGKLWLKKLMKNALPMKERGWRIATIRFALFFLVMAGLNEVVWRTQSTDFWVSFKIFGLTGFNLVFVLFQLPLFKRYALEESQEEISKDIKN